jgi:putative DNA primase/helicase
VGVEKIAARVQGDVEAFIKDNIKAGANEKVYRAAKTFALIAVAGELLIEFKISPWYKDEALTSAKWALEQWIAVRGGTGSSEAKRQISQIRELIEKRRFDGFASPSNAPDGSIPDHRTIHDCVGYSVGKGDDEEWWFLVEQWKSACRGFDHNKAAETLGAKGLLEKDKDGKLSQTKKVRGKPMRVYVVTARIFDEDEGEGK